MRPDREGFFYVIFWLRTRFLCLDSLFPICTLTNMMVLCRYGRIMDQMERKRPERIAIGDLGGSRCPQCTGQVWGSEFCGEPFDERWGALVGSDCQLLGFGSRDIYSAGAPDQVDGPEYIFPD